MKKSILKIFKKAGVIFIVASLCLMAVTFSGCSLPTNATAFTVTYSGNGNTAGTAPSDSTTYASNSIVTLLDNIGNLERDGYAFDCWNSQADGNGTDYLAGGAFTITGNTLFYAKWVNENDLPRYATLKKVNLKPIEVEAPSYSVEPVMNVDYWTDVKLNEFSMTFGEYSTELPKYTFKDGFELQQGTFYEIADVEYVNLPINEFTSFSVDSNANYFKRIISTTDTLSFRSAFYIENFAKPEYVNPEVTESVGTVGGSTTIFQTQNYPVADDATQVTIEFTEQTLNSCGFSNYSVQFLFEITRGNIPAEDLYNITYDGNGTTEYIPVDNINYYSGSTAIVKEQGLMEISGSLFMGWNTQADGNGIAYIENDNLVITSDITLYAQWSNLANASIMGTSLKGAEINSATYTSGISTYLSENYEYGLTTYLYVSYSDYPVLSVSDFVTIIINPIDAEVTYVFLNGFDEIGYDEDFNTPSDTSIQISIQVIVRQGTQILDSALIHIRKIPN
jgi:hypothetical protein